MQTPAYCPGEVDKDFPMLSTSFEVLFSCSLLTKTRAAKIQIKKTTNVLPLLLPFFLLLLLLFSLATPDDGSKWETGAVHDRGVKIRLKKLMVAFNWSLNVQPAVTHPAQGTGLENIGPSGRGGMYSPPAPGRVECRHPAPPHSQPFGPGF